MPAPDSRPLVPRLLGVLGLIVAAGFVMFAVREAAFYAAPSAERPLNEHFALLRSSGFAGLSFGMVGTALVFLNLAYLARRQFIRWERLGALRNWMALHVFTGLVGGGLVLLHSTFLPRSALGELAFWSMAVVLATGLIGRYIYSRVPRSLQGRELAVEEIHRRLTAYRQEMESLGLSHRLFELDPGPRAGREGFFSSVDALFAGDRAARSEFRLLEEAVASSEKLAALRDTLLPLARKFSRERQWYVRHVELRNLMSGWRFFHRWFAILMLVTVAGHVYVAVRHGHLSIFGAGR